MTVAAPFYAELADGPEGGEAVWMSAADGVRVRLALWPKGAKGTVLMLPGRTEYVEKYARAAGDLAARGYASVAIDWRGQGLADRAQDDPLVGHVDDFDEFQRDFDLMPALARELGLPEPFYLLSHSMGGAIALRALYRGAPVKAAAFSAPMWGILMAAWMRPVALTIAALSQPFGQLHRYAPTTKPVSYIATSEFAGNFLTTDPDMWDYMKRQIVDVPALQLAGPSLGWLRAALYECGDLGRRAAPPHPAYTALGTAEQIVDVGPIHMRMAGWGNGRLDLIAGAKHEIIMETPATRARFFDAATALFDANR